MNDKNFNEFFTKVVEDADCKLQYTILAHKEFKEEIEVFLASVKEKYVANGFSKSDYAALFTFITAQIENEHEQIYADKSTFFPKDLFVKQNLKNKKIK